MRVTFDPVTGADCVVIHKGCSVGPTIGILENVIGYALRNRSGTELRPEDARALRVGGFVQSSPRFVRG